MPHTSLRPAFTFTEERLARLKQVAPEAFSDGKVNWASLRAALGDNLEQEGGEAEHFGLFWPGKRAARKLTSIPSQGALLPGMGKGVNADASSNFLIEGENLEVLKLIQKAYMGRVKMIYIDPPYNTGNDFVYNDDFTDPLGAFLRKTGRIDERGAVVTTNTRSDGRFHSNWLSMIYPRLRLARELLSEDGAIFISIDDNELHNLRMVLGELFGEENFVATIVWQRSKKGDSKLIAQTHEYIVVFARNRETLVGRGGWRRKKPGVDAVLAHYAELRSEYKNHHGKIRDSMRQWYRSLSASDPRKSHAHYNWSDERGLYFADNFAGPDDGRRNRPRYDILHPKTGKPCAKPSTGWRWDEARTKAALAEDPPRVHFGPDHTTIPCRKSYLAEIDTESFPSVFYADGRSATLEVEGLVGKGVFPFPKNVEVIADLVALGCPTAGIVLDFFAGSGTTAQAVMEQVRKDGVARSFILVQLPEPTPEDSKARENGYADVAAIARRRVKEAIKKLRDEATSSSSEDLGFQCLSLGESAFRPWADYQGNDAAELESLFAAAGSPLRDGWTPDQLQLEVQLLEGFPLDSTVSTLATTRNSLVTSITSASCGHRLVTCFDQHIDDGVLDELELHTEDVFVCLDSAITDEQKLGLADRCNLKTI